MTSPRNEDLFNSLPDDIITKIFYELDNKSLCRCLTISKRFAFIVSQMSFVALHIDNFDRRYRVSIDGEIKSFTRYLRIPYNACLVVNYLRELPMGIKFLKNFNAIQSLHIDYPFPNCHHNKSEGNYCFDFPFPNCHHNRSKDDYCFVKWNAEFGTHLENVVILSSASFHAMEEEVSEEPAAESEHLIRKRRTKSIFCSAFDCLQLASLRHAMLRSVVSEIAPSNQKLRKVTATDLEREGKVCVRGENLARLVNSLRYPFSSMHCYSKGFAMEGLYAPFYAKLWYAPSLQLSSSGYVMKEASLVMIKRCRVGDSSNNIGVDARILASDYSIEEEEEAHVFGEDKLNGLEGCDDNHDTSLLLSAFEDEEEKVYGEAVREILRNENTIRRMFYSRNLSY